MMSRILANVDSMQKLEDFSPADLKQRLEQQTMQPSQDPIAKDLSKIQGKRLPIISSQTSGASTDVSMEELSLRLRELLELILDPVLPDESRMHYEQALKGLISKPPTLKTGQKTYPDDYISRILIDNYALFLQMATSYFNLSFSSLVTRYLVSIVYSLECWEIYHLLLIVPNLEYILKLLEFEIKSTSFGHIVKPPSNFLDYNLRQGLQYPFPFPFYNFSYHSVDPRAGSRKMKRISIKPYIDLRLDKSPQKTKPAKSGSRFPKMKPTDQGFSYVSDSDLSSAGSEDYQKWQIVYAFVEMTPDKIMQDFEHSFVTPAQKAYEDEEYDSDRARLIDAKEIETAETSTGGLKIAFSVFQKAFTKANDHGLIKHTFLHQCKLMDPASQKTCLKVFYGKNELHRHQEFVHATKKRLYRCTYCSKEGSSSNNLKKVYPRYDSLSRHLRRKHGIVGRENKSAVMLARRVAETEETFGKHALLLNPDDRATLSRNTSIPRVEDDAYAHSLPFRDTTGSSIASHNAKGQEIADHGKQPGTLSSNVPGPGFNSAQGGVGSAPQSFAGSRASAPGNIGTNVGRSHKNIPASPGPNYSTHLGASYEAATGGQSTGKAARRSSVSGPSSKRRKSNSHTGDYERHGHAPNSQIGVNRAKAKATSSPVPATQTYTQPHPSYVAPPVNNESKNEFENEANYGQHNPQMGVNASDIQPSSDVTNSRPVGTPVHNAGGPRTNPSDPSEMTQPPGAGLSYTSQYAPYGHIPSGYGGAMYPGNPGYTVNSGNSGYVPNHRNGANSSNFNSVAGSKGYGSGISYGQSLPVGLPGSSQSQYQYMSTVYPQLYSAQPAPPRQLQQHNNNGMGTDLGRNPSGASAQDSRPSHALGPAPTSGENMPAQSRTPTNPTQMAPSQNTHQVHQPHQGSDRKEN